MTHIDLDTVLSDDDWLRRIARRLVSDAHTADDLAQDAWLAAHESGRGVRASRPWLAGVMRNSGRRKFRSRTREQDRVVRAVEGRSTSSPATDEVVEALQLRERAARELLALEEPYRRAIYLVYVSDHSISEAARRDGVATSTMSERVQRGLAKLRARMDAAYGGDRRAWAGVLLPLALPESAVTGGHLVGAWGVAVAAIVALGAFGLWAAGAAGSAGGEVRRVDVARGVAGAQDLDLAPVDAGSGARDAVGSSVPGTMSLGGGTAGVAARVVGRFLWPNGEPAEGARWSVHAWGRNEDARIAFGGLEEWIDLSGTLDAGGRLEADFVPPASAQFSIWVGETGRAKAGWRISSIQGGQTLDLGTVSLHPVGVVAGRLVDAAGDPVTGRRFRVQVDDYEFRQLAGRSFNTMSEWADETTGAFRIESVPSGGAALIALLDGPWSQDPIEIEVPAGSEVSVDLLVEGLDAFEETVIASLSSKPSVASRIMTGEHVRLFDAGGGEYEAVKPSYRSPQFEFHGVGAGPFTLRVEHPDFEVWEQDDVAAGDRVRVRLRGNAAIELDVSTPTGDRVAIYSVDVEAAFAGSSGDKWRAHAGETALEGGLLDGLVPADYRVWVEASEGRAEFLVPSLGPRESRAVDVALVVTGSVRGRIARPNGDPVAGVDVRLCTPAEVDDSADSAVLDSRSQTNRPERARIAVHRVTTDADGRYELCAPTAGRFLVIARPAGAIQVDSDLVEVESGETVDGIDLVVPSHCTVSGRIEFPPHADPAGWSVQVAIVEERDATRVTDERPAVQPDGTFLIDAIPPGSARLYLFQPGVGNSWGPGPPTGTFLVEEFDLAPGEAVDRESPWPDPTFLTVELDVPTGLSAPQWTWLTGQHVHGRAPRAKGAGPTLGPMIADVLDYGIAIRGEDWLFWQPSFLPATPGEVGRTVSVDVERRRMRVLVAGAPQPDARIMVYEPNDDWTGLKTFTADAEGWVDAALSATTFRLSCGTSHLELAWPPPAGQTELRFD